MTEQAINEAIAIACGWKIRSGNTIVGPCGVEDFPWKEYQDPQTKVWHGCPLNYCGSLDAMKTAIDTLPDDNGLHGLVFYCNTLMGICGSHRACVNSTAKQRADAFVITTQPLKEPTL